MSAKWHHGTGGQTLCGKPVAGLRLTNFRWLPQGMKAVCCSQCWSKYFAKGEAKARKGK